MASKLKRYFKICFWLGILGLIAIALVILYYSQTLPNYEKLSAYEPPVTSRLYAKDGELVDEFAKEKRSFVPMKFIPSQVKNAFLAAEDSNFYEHAGVDIKSLFRAMYQNIFRFKEGKNFIGASTITQQVVKNILLTKERTIARKIKEAILAVRISKTLSKERVLELYLNEIYLGYRSYGVAAAALNYFNKSLDDLSVAESALIAAMPKAPSSLDPRKNYDRALERRNWVIDRMYQDGFIEFEAAELAKSTPILLRERQAAKIVSAGSYSGYVKKQLIDMYDKKELIEGGLVIHSALDPDLQNAAYKALKKGLKRYDLRHGYRGALKNIAEIAVSDINDGTEQIIMPEDWIGELSEVSRPIGIKGENWDLALVLEIVEDRAIIGFEDSMKGYISLSSLEWAKKPSQLVDEETGEVTNYLAEVKAVSDVFSIGDVVIVERNEKSLDSEYLLRQIPNINGAIIAMNPHNGAINAMVGGYNDSKTEFNRATQAMRQPGSIIKPFTYLAAIENNFPLNTIIIDDEVRMKKEDGSYWVPMNYSNKFYGPTPMRLGLEKSRNVVTVRLAEMVGISKIADVVTRYGLTEEPISNYAMVLGALESNLLNITTSYAMIANGGKKINPFTIEKVQNKEGKTIYKRDARECASCNYEELDDSEIMEIPNISDDRERITDERSAYQAISLLEGVVKRGTGWRARILKKPMAGKTGTTNDSLDTWFVGFSPDMVVGVWVGFDTPKSLGKKETGSSVTVPIFIDVMKEAQKDYIARPFKVPDDIKFAKIDRNTGESPTPTSLKRDIIYEVFKSENFDKFISGGNNDVNQDSELDYETNIY